ncbi:glycosyltransferase [Pedobacter sp. N36a]|uniref:glycosyltransferase family 2 protein n=1 Tax=Pedobacter sp. N36a TaxID=2767996 RepID=UPI0016572354|nr:glycosyltransferase family 2 protein [Pedobacter sp. N36a]MBC8986176.1 glycosyltransferase [Pedobacter sp. N36a]
MNGLDVNILVSIVTIVYNDSENLEATIKSVQQQTYKNIEYIIIDGGSTDNSINIIKNHETNISYWVSEKDKGISDAFNKGVLRAKGELIGLINSGDSYEPNAVELMVNFYRDNCLKGNDYIVLHGDIKMFNENGHKVYKPLNLQSFDRQMPIWHPTVFASHQVYEDFLYNLDYRIAMDYELFSRVYGAGGQFKYVNSVISNMNVGGISNMHASKGFREVMIASRNNLNVSVFKSYFSYQYRCVLNMMVSFYRKYV